MRGRDIKRYSYNWAGLYIINTHNGYNDVERIHIDEYPALKRHLDNHWNMIAKRADKGATPYNLRNCAYVDEFSKPKIVWIELSDKPQFALCDSLVPLNTVFFLTGEYLEHILGQLNSKLVHWYFTHCLGTTSGVGTNRWLKYTIEQLPLIAYSCDRLTDFVKAKAKCADDDELDKKIDYIVCELFNLDFKETEYIMNLG